MNTPWLNRMFRFSNFRVALSAGGKSATVQLSGLSPEDFNRVGTIGIWRILNWFTWSRVGAYHPRDGQADSFLEYDKMTSGVLTFMASSRTSVNDAFYKLLDSDVVPALSVQLHLGYVGTSSLNTVAVLSESKSGIELARNVNQVVVIDKATRRPTPIPDWWRHKYESFVVENERLIVPSLDIPTENTFRYDLKVSWNDIDGYRHANFVSYVRYCFDAAMEAVDKKFYSCFHDDILKYRVKDIESAYKGECQAGDCLTVVTWQNAQNPFKLHFSLEKVGKVIFQSSVEFFE